MSIVLKSMNRLSEIYSAQGKNEEEFYDDLLETEERIHGKDSTQVLVLLPLLGIFFFNKQNYSHAEKFYRQAIISLGNQQDPENEQNKLSLFTFTNDLAACLQEQGKEQEAAELRNFFKNSISKTNFSPPPSLSRFLKTISCSIKFEPDLLDSERVIIYYEAVVETKESQPLPEGAICEFNFENPVFGEEPYKVDYSLEKGKQTITVKSPHLPEVNRGYYSVPVFIYSNDSKIEKIGSHYLWCRSPISANQNESSDDVTLKIYESSGFENGIGGGEFSF